jgi:hypothetical protein
MGEFFEIDIDLDQWVLLGVDQQVSRVLADPVDANFATVLL